MQFHALLIQWKINGKRLASLPYQSCRWLTPQPWFWYTRVQKQTNVYFIGKIDQIEDRIKRFNYYNIYMVFREGIRDTILYNVCMYM